MSEPINFFTARAMRRPQYTPPYTEAALTLYNARVGAFTMLHGRSPDDDDRWKLLCRAAQETHIERGHTAGLM